MLINCLTFLIQYVSGHCKKTVQPDNFVRTDSLKKITLPFPDSFLRPDKNKSGDQRPLKKRSDTEKPYD